MRKKNRRLAANGLISIIAFIAIGNTLPHIHSLVMIAAIYMILSAFLWAIFHNMEPIDLRNIFKNKKK